MAAECQSLMDRVSARLGLKAAGEPVKKQLLPNSKLRDLLSPDPESTNSPVLPSCTQKLLLSDSDTNDSPLDCHHKPDWNQPDCSGKSKNTNFPSNQKSRSVVLLSDSSDDDFECFLTQLKTPKQVSRPQKDSLKGFLIDSDEDDFVSVFPSSRKKTGIKNGSSDFKSTEVSTSAGQGSTLYRGMVSPVFISDSDDSDSVIMKSTWKDRDKSRRNQKSDNECNPRIESSRIDGGLRKKDKENLSGQSNELHLGGSRKDGRSEPTFNMPESSDEEFDCLVERIKNRVKTPSSTVNKMNRPKAATTEPAKLPCFDLTNHKEYDSVRKPRSQGELPSIPRVPSVKPFKVPDDPTEKPRSESVKYPCRVPDCFLQDLSHPKSQYVKSFKQNKEELTQRLYSLYNRTIFDQKLPENMEIIWNKKMRKTAGYCVTGQKKCPGLQRYARIELSEKVCDSADRLRDTLIHEICHAATWLINGVRDGHGQFWRLYARKSTITHPELPMVTRCHTYEINYKYTYECSRCKNTIGRHSKSLDTGKFVCALCQGKLTLLGSSRKDGTPTNNQLNPFAKFVKDNYGTTKKELSGLSHAEVMRKLSADFSSKTKI